MDNARDRVVRHHPQPASSSRTTADEVRRGGGQSAVLARQVGGRQGARDTNPTTAVLARHAAQEQRGLRLHHPHDRDHRRRGGRVGVVVPHGVLFRGGAEGVIRKS